MYFPANIAKLLRTSFLKSTFCSLYFSEILSDDRILCTSFGTKLIFFIFFCATALIFFILVLESGAHGYFVLVFIPQFLASIIFARITMLQSETISRIIATSPSILL